ncbi:hypothetical protein ACFL57_01510 [Candidatus Margulisiibacteriota bacterium]
MKWLFYFGGFVCWSSAVISLGFLLWDLHIRKVYKWGIVFWRFTILHIITLVLGFWLFSY